MGEIGSSPGSAAGSSRHAAESPVTIYDPLYGAFQPPDYLLRLLGTPELRRLSGVRLLNTLSPSLATLGEVRRYSHTLGVLHLALVNKTDSTVAERKALLASALLHDVGTPPFGHLFEYHLAETSEWSHERFIEKVLWGLHAPENRAHQLHAGRTIEAFNELERAGIDKDLVRAIVRGEHRLSRLLFSALDLDNLDNVARMAWALGLHDCRDIALLLAESLSISSTNMLELRRSTCETAVKKWLATRREVYDIVAFDMSTIAAQAVLSRAILIAMERQIVSEVDWTLTDEEFLGRLQGDTELRDLINLEYLGRLPKEVFSVRVCGTLEELGLGTRMNAVSLVEDTVAAALGRKRVLGYVFPEVGVFDRELTFVDSAGDGSWTVGADSASVTLSAFAQSAQTPSLGRCRGALGDVVGRLSLSPSQILRWRVGGAQERADGQEALALTFG